MLHRRDLLKHAYPSVLFGDGRRPVAHPEHALSKEFLRWMLSDGAGAFLIEARPRKNGMSLRIDWCDIYYYANTMPACMYNGRRRNTDDTFTRWMHVPPEQWARDAIFQIVAKMLA